MSPEEFRSERTLGRRQFVAVSSSALLMAPLAPLLAGCASLVTRAVAPIDGKLHLALAHYPELSEPGGVLRIRPEGAAEPVYVLVNEARQHIALSPICTHLGCTVEVQTARLVCPCHGSTYDREGTVLQGPAQRPLARYAVELTADGVLVIDLGKRT
jgi:cytochrome b6-f complex iron-sulfur subunit